ncbi:MAG: hypothetical protein ACTHVX_07345, partial [Candidatus Corynebacterium faecigallinarum]
EAWSHLLARLGDIGMDVDFHDNPDVVERTGAYTLNVHTAVPGSVPPAELDTANAWYVLRLAPELGGGRVDGDAGAVIAEVLGHIFVGHAPQVWSDPRIWTEDDSPWPQGTPATSHWWMPSRLVDPDLLTSRHFTEVQAQEAIVAGLVGMARAGLLHHLPDSGEMGAVDGIPKEFRWERVFAAASDIEELLTGRMPQRMVYPPADDRRTRDLNEP